MKRQTYCISKCSIGQEYTMYFLLFVYFFQDMRPFEVAVDSRPQNHRKKAYLEVRQTWKIHIHGQSPLICN